MSPVIVKDWPFIVVYGAIVIVSVLLPDADCDDWAKIAIENPATTKGAKSPSAFWIGLRVMMTELGE